MSRPLTALCVTCLAASSCTGGDEAVRAARPAAAAVVVRPATVTVPAGGSVQLQAQVNDAGGHPVGGAPIAFRSTDPQLVRTSDTGLLVSMGGIGRTTISVASGSEDVTLAVTVTPGKPSRIEKVSGDAQTATVGGRLLEPLVINVLDEHGNGVAGATVSFQASGGSLEPGSTRTGSSGLASAVWTLGPSAGPQAAEASLTGDAPVKASFLGTATPGPAATVEKVGADPARLVAGTDVDVAVRVSDAFGNIVPRASVSWRVSGGGGSVTPEVGATDDLGVARAHWTGGASAGENRLLAALGGDAGTAATFVVLSVPGSPAMIVVTGGDQQETDLGTAVKTPPAIRVEDGHGNGVPGAVVRWEIAEGGGSVATPSAVTDDHGVATVRWTLGAAGANALTASVDGVAEPARVNATARSPHRR